MIATHERTGLSCGVIDHVITTLIAVVSFSLTNAEEVVWIDVALAANLRRIVVRLVTAALGSFYAWHVCTEVNWNIGFVLRLARLYRSKL